MGHNIYHKKKTKSQEKAETKKRKHENRADGIKLQDTISNFLSEFKENNNFLKESEQELKNLSKTRRKNNFIPNLIFPELPSLPDLYELKNLNTLDLVVSKSSIENIIDQVSTLGNVQYLTLNTHNIIKLPSNIKNLTQLEMLTINDSRTLENLSDLYLLNNIEILSIIGTNISELSKNISNLKKLYSLSLQNNSLKELPEEIWKLGVFDLDLSGNGLTYISDEIINLTNVEALGLNNNNLEFLPENIGNLPSLEYLNLLGNNFKSLPASILKLDNRKIKIESSLSLLDLVNNSTIARRVDEDTLLNNSRGNLMDLNWVEQEVFEDSRYVFSFVPKELDSSSLEYLSLEETQLLLSDRIDAGKGSILRTNLSEIKRPLGTVLIPQGESYLEAGLNTMDRLDILTEWININRKLPDRHNHHIPAIPSDVVGFKYRHK